MATRAVNDWVSADRIAANIGIQRLKKSLPVEWLESIDILRGTVADNRTYEAAQAWRDAVESFAEKHGDAGYWNMSDSEIVEKAKDVAAWVEQRLDLHGDSLTDAVRLDKICALCDLVGVEYPKSLTALGAVNRAMSDVWWRRVLRRKVSRVVEAGAIKIGAVHRGAGGYCSGSAVQRRKAQKDRNAAMLGKTLMRNEAGQVFTLAELAAKSTANPEIRGGELMTRIRGCEEYADKAGHVGYFLTGTCPSRFHAVQISGKGPGATIRKNPKYDGVSTPRDAQLWLRDQWAKTRAQWARDGVEVYGFRVAEPHHDGCPHWHLLLWFFDDAQAVTALSAFGEKWLSDGGEVVSHAVPDNRVMVFTGDGHERGALANRVNIKRMTQGGAAGYVAKYIAKSIGHFDVGTQLDTVDGSTWELDTREVKGWQRVDAWAATWGIRQFQAIGQPSVTAWRELRRVTKDQIEVARVAGDAIADKLWHACQKIGDIGADWCRYMTHQGGAAIGRDAYAVKTAHRVEPGHVNGYGETIEKKTVIGLLLRSGRVLVSRRQMWCHVGGEVTLQQSDDRAAMGAPWTGFNNCTARLGGQLRAAMLGLLPGDWGAYGGNLV
jgi:hypothetical protein